MTIRPDTNTPAAPTKVDHDMALAGKQRINGGITSVDVHLPYSPASGEPLNDQAFSEGRGWAEVQNSVHPGSGPSNLSW